MLLVQVAIWGGMTSALFLVNWYYFIRDCSEARAKHVAGAADRSLHPRTVMTSRQIHRAVALAIKVCPSGYQLYPIALQLRVVLQSFFFTTT